MRISDWSSDVCSSDLEDYIQDNEITETGDVRTALVEEKRFDIWIEEANYGNADPFPDFARQHGLAFGHRWGSGGGFGPGDRKSGVSGKGWSVRVDLGGRRIIKTKKKKQKKATE